MKFILVYIFFSISMLCYAQKGFELVEKAANKKVEILFNGKLLTAYCYFDSTEKPVLFPIKTLTGNVITRGWPVAPRAGERRDHPHQVGLWLTYESVNGIDFWNNSLAIPQDRKYLYGSIKHQKVISAKSDSEKAVLKTLSYWVDAKGNSLLTEEICFIFSIEHDDFIIDRISVLKATVPKVVFKDVKDGFIGLRVARQLEMPSTQEDKLADEHGNVPAFDNENGMYVNAKGAKGDDVWSSRAIWTSLTGKKDGEIVSIAMIDHPKNVGYPTYWHARGYGLFAANPLGQKIFSNGKEELNFTLKKNESATFAYRIVIHTGSELTTSKLDSLAGDFSNVK